MTAMTAMTAIITACAFLYVAGYLLTFCVAIRILDEDGKFPPPWWQLLLQCLMWPALAMLMSYWLVTDLIQKRRRRKELNKMYEEGP